MQKVLVIPFFRGASRGVVLSAFLAYVGLAIAMTWPLVVHLDSMVLRGYGDGFGILWNLWATLRGAWESGVNPWVAAPFGVSDHFQPRQPILDLLTVLPARCFGEVVAFNLFILFSFISSAFATFLFLWDVLRKPVPAFLGGVIFGFSPAAFARAGAGHLGFVFNAFVPLLVWALWVNRQKRSGLSSVGVGGAYGLMTLACLYWGFFGIFICLLFFVMDFLTRPPSCSLRRFFLNYGACGAVAIIGVVPFQWMWLKALFSPALKATLVSAELTRPLLELKALSARSWEYFLPSVDHVGVGPWLLPLVQRILHGSNATEQTLYLGIVPLTLFFYGVRLYRRRAFSPDSQELFRLFLWQTLGMLVLSARPYFSLGPLKIPLLSYFLHGIAPMFRAYCRAGILALFFIGSGAAVAGAYLQEKLPKSRQSLWGVGLFGFLIFEFWNAPPRVAVDSCPAVYSWLAQQPGDLIAEYPMAEYNEATHSSYLFWQRFHQKRIVNGANPSDGTAWLFYQQVRDLSNPTTLALLRKVGTQFLVVHLDGYREGPIPFPIKKYYPARFSQMEYNGGQVPDLSFLGKPEAVFGSTHVFRI